MHNIISAFFSVPTPPSLCKVFPMAFMFCEKTQKFETRPFKTEETEQSL